MASRGAAGHPFGWLREGPGGRSPTAQPGKVDRWKEVVSHPQFKATPTATEPRPMRSAKAGEAAEGRRGLRVSLGSCSRPAAATQSSGLRARDGVGDRAIPLPGNGSSAVSARAAAPPAGHLALAGPRRPPRPAGPAAVSGAERSTLWSFSLIYSHPPGRRPGGSAPTDESRCGSPPRGPSAPAAPAPAPSPFQVLGRLTVIQKPPLDPSCSKEEKSAWNLEARLPGAQAAALATGRRLQGLSPGGCGSPAEALWPGASSVPTRCFHTRGELQQVPEHQASAEMGQLGARPSPPPGVGGQKRPDTCCWTPAEKAGGLTWRLGGRPWWPWGGSGSLKPGDSFIQAAAEGAMPLPHELRLP